MNIKKPLFWDQKKANFLSYVIFPLTFFIKINNLFLNFFPKKKFNEIKTVCIGNIYLGGTGKTPTSIRLYQLLKTKNYNVIIGKKHYPSQKDEEILIKNRSNLISSQNREAIVKIAMERKYELIIFDDGLQEKSFDYDLKFVCFDSKIWVGNGFLIPSGPLRENINSLKKYDGVFLKITDKNTNLIDITSKIKKINPKIEIFNSHVEITNINEFDPSDKYMIFSGIGNSTSFREILINNKFNIIEEKIFSDHFEYKDEDIHRILEISKKKNLKTLTTEKDYVKIQNENKDNINFIKIDLEFLDQKEFIMFIKSKLNEKN